MVRNMKDILDVPPKRGKGRKPLSKNGEVMTARPLRMTEEQWEKCKRLGGAAWVRAKIDMTKEKQ